MSVLDQSSGYAQACELAKSLHARLPTLKEFIKALGTDPELYGKAKGDLYWLADEPGLKIDGYCRIDYENGTITDLSTFGKKLTKEEWMILPKELRAFAYAGDEPLVLNVMNGGFDDHRLEVNAADFSPADSFHVAIIHEVEIVHPNGAHPGPIVLEDASIKALRL